MHRSVYRVPSRQDLAEFVRSLATDLEARTATRAVTPTRVGVECLEPRHMPAATISGIVFEDYNDNGAQDSLEPGVGSVLVTAYNSTGTAVASATTSTAQATLGQYTLSIPTGTSDVRLQFTDLPTGFYAAQDGTDSSSPTQFVNVSGGNATASLGILAPSDYANANPTLVTPTYVFGNQLTGPNASAPTLVSFPANATGTSPAPTTLATASQIGTTWGVAYSNATNSVYASAYQKFAAGFGPSGTGAIYQVNVGTGTVSTLVDLNAVFGAGTTGTDPHTNSDFTQDTTASYADVGKIGLGGLALSADQSTLYTINLANGKLYAIPTTNPNASNIQSFSIPVPADASSAQDMRPFAVAQSDGLIYVGTVDSAQSTQNAADLKAYVYTFNPATGQFSTNPVLEVPLNYTRGQANTNTSGDWNPWSDTWESSAFVDGSTFGDYAQPMLTSIAFDNGALVLGLRDRFGDQVGYDTNNPFNAADPTLYSSTPAGDLLRAAPNGDGGWTIENDATSVDSLGNPSTSAGAGNNEGPGGGRYYYQQNFVPYHDNVATGAVVNNPGSGEVISTVFDPGSSIFTGGVRTFSDATGEETSDYQVYGVSSSNFGKANGTGGLVALNSAPSIEIGSRVWLDTNGNGIEDPGESGIANVTIDLYQGTTLVGTTTTDANGDYLFNSADVPGGLLPNTVYQARFDNAADFATGGPLAGLSLTTVPTGANANPMAESKAVTGASGPVINFTTGVAGANDFTEDAGFANTAQVAGYVYLDANNDGIFEGTETPIPNVTLTLTGKDSNGDTVDLTTITNASGAYDFNDLLPGTYTVTETPPTGYLVGKITAGVDGGTTGNSAISNFTLTAGADDTGNNFGHLEAANASGFVYVDANDDGTFEPSETPLSNVTVTLTGTDVDGDAVNETTTTAANGLYGFAPLVPGIYTVTETPPAGYLNGKITPGTDGGTVVAQTISNITLSSDATDPNNNFGQLVPGTLSGFAYVDANNSGIFEPTDTTLYDVAITLTGTNDLNAAIDQTTTTGENGSYSFTNLRPGTYTLTETPPTGYAAGKITPGSEGGTAGSFTITGASVASGTNGTGNNFASLLSTGLTGVVYNDPNDDGIQETGETGIPNVTLTLTGTTTLGGAVSLTTSTNASGQYAFTGLAAGTYTVTETLPTGDLAGKTSAGSLGGTASSTAISQVVIPNGDTATAYNFPVLQPSQISGTVYTDLNDNGVEDSNETGLMNAILTLTGTDDLGMSVNLTTQTNATGAFSFTGLRPGDYTLVDTPPGTDLRGKTIAGTQGGTAGLGSITGITLTAGTDGESNFFAVVPPAQISGLIYEDLNDNGVQDPGEPALAGAVVTITGTNDLGASVTESETTGSTGTYDFTNLRPGSYSVAWTLPPGLDPGAVAVGSQGGAANSGTFGPFTLTAGQVGSGNVTAAVPVSAGTLSGKVYYDLNHNGTYDTATDFGIVNVTLTLTGTTTSGTAVNQVVQTDANGNYTFSNLAAGTYTITETHPNHFRDYVDNPGTLGGTAGRDVISGITVAAGATGTAYNFGELQEPGCNLRNLAIEVGDKFAADEAAYAANPTQFLANHPNIGADIAAGVVPRGVGGFPVGPLAYSLVPTLGTKVIPMAHGVPVGSNPTPIQTVALSIHTARAKAVKRVS